jgi:alkanesulfonate monooxygenase SsuD/methylene tetrahydromethanopterin reductase-like flavin-dependent oxidoreductase (luciferase family)
MRLGMYLDMRNPKEWPRPPGRHYGRWLERVVEAERLGAETVWLTEHHFFDDGHLPQCWTFAAAIAARTSTVRIGSAVALLPLHSAVEVAEQIALVDVISDGRVEPGFGVGYRKPEYQAFDGDFKRRYEVFGQRIGELRQLWGEEPGAVRVVTPAPVQRRVPMWGGFGGPRGARLAGRLGLGLQSIEPGLLEPYETGLVQGGHDQIEFLLADDPERAWSQVKDHVVYRWNSYNRYMFEGTRRESAPPAVGDDGAIGGRIEIGTPAQIAAVIKDRTAGLPVSDLWGWSDFPGMTDELVDRHLELTFTELAPLLR